MHSTLILLDVCPNLRFPCQALVGCFPRLQLMKRWVRPSLFHTLLSTIPGTTQSILPPNYCRRWPHLVVRSMNMSLGVEVGLAHHQLRITPPAPLRTHLTVLVSRGGRLGMLQLQHQQVHARWRKYQTALRRTGHVTIRTILCQFIPHLRIITLDKLHRMLCMRNHITFTLATQRYSRITNSLIILRFHAPYHHKVFSGCCKAMQIVMEDAHRTSRTCRIHQICTHHCMRNLATRQNPT
jgi:hypothetical protein